MGEHPLDSRRRYVAFSWFYALGMGFIDWMDGERIGPFERLVSARLSKTDWNTHGGLRTSSFEHADWGRASRHGYPDRVSLECGAWPFLAVLDQGTHTSGKAGALTHTC